MIERSLQLNITIITSFTVWQTINPISTVFPDMGRALNYFIGILFSRMSIYAYGIGSSVTTALFYIGFLMDIVTMETRALENVPVIIEMFLRILIPFWVPPITSGNILAFLMNINLAFMVLLYWTHRYDAGMGRHRMRRGRGF